MPTPPITCATVSATGCGRRVSTVTIASSVSLQDEIPIRSWPSRTSSRYKAAAAPTALMIAFSSPDGASATTASSNPYRETSASSSSECPPDGGTINTFTMPSSSARLSSRETLACDTCSSSAIWGCLRSCSWYMRATRVTSRSRLAGWAYSTDPSTILSKSGSVCQVSEQGVGGEPRGFHRVLGILSRLHRSEVQALEPALHATQEAHGLFGRTHRVLTERELVELPHAVPVVLGQDVEELEELHGMYGAGDHVVVPAAQVVVDVHAEQAAVVDGELGGVGRRLASVKRMAEVEKDADVGQVDLLQGEQRARHRVVAHVDARLTRLVLDDELEVRVLLRELRDPVHRHLPQLVVVDLERVVPAVLAGPELHVGRTKLTHDARRLGDEVMGCPPHPRIGVGERAAREASRVHLGRDPDHGQVVLGEPCLDLAQRCITTREGVVEVDDAQVPHLTCPVDHVEHADRLGVPVGGVPVDVAGKLPDPGTELHLSLIHISEPTRR